MLGIRSRTHLTADVLQAADRLMVVGCFSVRHQPGRARCREAARHPRVQCALFEHPSVAELTNRRSRDADAPNLPALGVGACRRLGQVGQWHPRGARQDARESIGYGNIGSQLSNLARAMGKRDLFDLTDSSATATPQPVESLDELLAMSDVVSLHLPRRRRPPT